MYLLASSFAAASLDRLFEAPVEEKRCSTGLANKAAGSEGPEAYYCERYVEGNKRPRTQLGAIFSIALLAQVPADTIPLQETRNHCQRIGIDHDADDDEQHAADCRDTPQIGAGLFEIGQETVHT